ncbi:MAG: GTPase Era [Candidatus Nanopelagicaceae bacterium]
MSGSMSGFRSGFVAIVGRPNTGKSTLVNALVGSKIVITSPHPNTTRRAIRGILNGPDFQAILVDTPGIHKPKTLLGHRLNAVVEQSMDSVDVIVMCLPADESSGAGDDFLIQEITKYPKAKKIAVITKTDLVSKTALAAKLAGIVALAKQFTWHEIVPVSAAIHDQVDLLSDLIGKSLPPGPEFYPAGMISDQSQDQWICELIREAALRDAREELPHSITVTIDELTQREGSEEKPFFDIHATIHVERDSQRAILLGHQGERLKDIGMRARADIERILAARVYLGLHIKVSKDWQRNPKLLERLGFSDQ